MKTVEVSVKPDHLEKLTNCKPVAAIAELIWNSLDADATEISIEFQTNQLGGLDSISVVDNGHGISFSEAIPSFQNLGGSWKRTAPHSKQKHRFLHGKSGEGRFRAFALGQMVDWIPCQPTNNGMMEFSIRGRRDQIEKFQIDDEPRPSSRTRPGTIVMVTNVEKKAFSLQDEAARQDITRQFALYLRRYRDIGIRYGGHLIDPKASEDHSAEYRIDSVLADEAEPISAVLTIVEWRFPATRTIALCDEDGVTLKEEAPGIQAPGFSFTAYLCSSHIRKLADSGMLELEHMDAGLRRLLDAAQGKMREHFRKRTILRSAGVVDRWKKDKVYPYSGEPHSQVELIERQVFDIVALNLSEYLPEFEKTDTKNKRLSFRLLRQAIEESPAAVQRILNDVLELPREKQEEFAELLQKTSLTAIINASRLVVDRLEFLRGLELLLFNPESKAKLLERSQLHRILAENTWVFGEQFNLTVDDESLTEVLKRHLELLGQKPSIHAPVLKEDGSKGIVDLMLSRRIPLPTPEEREHLVIELKRPNQKIDNKAASQIEEYADAVAADDRFRDTKTRWHFIVVSNEMDENVRRRAHQANRPDGLLRDDREGKIFIWARTWAQIIEDCRGRLEFIRKHLEYNATAETARAHLNKVYKKYLPEQ